MANFSHRKRSKRGQTALVNEFVKQVTRARQDLAILAELEDLYAQVDEQIDQLRPKCLGGGACCRFDLAGHRLYVSTIELALLTTDSPCNPEKLSLGRCPYQQGPRCTTRRCRPLGCRTYFCQESTTRPCQEIYEGSHEIIRRLHESAKIEYTYIDLISALVALLEFEGFSATKPGKIGRK